MSVTAVAGSDEDVRQMCATVAQAGAGTGGNAVHSRCQLLSDHDAVVAVRVDAHEYHFALEYERTPKATMRYTAIQKRIQAENLTFATSCIWLLIMTYCYSW
jgi:hypothetical protein